METLPVVLADKTFESLSNIDLKSIRLVCKSFASIAARCLFRQIDVLPHPNSFQRLESILQAPDIGQWVKSLRFTPGIVPPCYSFDDYQATVRTELRNKLSATELRAHYSSYRLYLAGQDGFRTQQLGLDL